MSIEKKPIDYSIKGANVRQLIEFIDDGNEQAKLELQTRLPAQLANLKKLYEVAYGIADAEKKLIEQLSGLSVSTNYKDTFENGVFFIN